jgi:hypothetical protein
MQVRLDELLDPENVLFDRFQPAKYSVPL